MFSSGSKGFCAMGAYACLVAVMLIYAPQGMIGWWAGMGVCCEADYCPIPGHHRQNARAAAEHQGMECEHGMTGKAGIAACGMSCCHETERALLAPMVFVIAPVAERPGLASVARVAEPPTVQDILQSSKPLSPPPRLVAAAS
jgi:hypothetical protein